MCVGTDYKSALSGADQERILDTIFTELTGKDEARIKRKQKGTKVEC